MKLILQIHFLTLIFDFTQILWFFTLVDCSFPVVIMKITREKIDGVDVSFWGFHLHKVAIFSQLLSDEVRRGVLQPSP